MKDKRLTQEEKVMIAVFLAVLALFCIGAYVIKEITQQTRTSSQLLPVPTAELITASGGKMYFPVIDFNESIQQVATSEAPIALPTEAPTNIPTLAPTEIPSNLWMITRDDPLAYYLNGYAYDLGEFKNVRTGEIIQAFCADPGWPGPNIGDLFIRNDWNVLIPTDNDTPPWKQRFIVIGG